MKCIKVLVHQQPYKEILWSFGLEELFSLRWSSSSWFLIWLDLSLSLPLWKSSCLITLEIWLLVLNLVLLSSKSRLTKPWFHSHNHSKRVLGRHRWEGFFKINIFPLTITFNHKSSFISLYLPTRITFGLKKPLAPNWFTTIWQFDQIPNTIHIHRIHFIIHGLFLGIEDNELLLDKWLDQKHHNHHTHALANKPYNHLK